MTKTLDEVQLEGHNRKVIAEQFAQDFLLVMMNDYEAYTELMDDTKKSESMVELSENLREEYETLTAQIVELVEEKVSPIASLLIAQLLQGQGSLPFDLIAKQLKEDAN
jgi:CRISPR/Cas system-associated exonuclease Cas4 (RecB family)